MADGWSPDEKKLARKLMEKACIQFERNVLKEMDERMFSSVDQLWKFEVELRKRRREHDMLFQFSYNLLEEKFATHIRKGLLKEEDMDGFRPGRAQRILEMKL